jgi:hypothetical protein
VCRTQPCLGYSESEINTRIPLACTWTPLNNTLRIVLGSTRPLASIKLLRLGSLVPEKKIQPYILTSSRPLINRRRRLTGDKMRATGKPGRRYSHEKIPPRAGLE